MTWIVAVLLGSVFASLRSLQARRIGINKLNLTAYGLFASFASVFMLGIFYSLFNNYEPSFHDASSAWGFILLGGALFATANYIVLSLYRKLPASAVIIMSLFNIVSVLIISRVFGSEILTIQQWIGAAILVSSAVVSKWITTPRSKKKKSNNLWHYYLLAVIVAIMYGFAVVNEKYLLSRVGIPTYLVFGWGTQFLFATIIALKLGLLMELKTSKENHINSWLLGFLLALSGFLFIQTLTLSGSASITVIGSSMSLVFALLLAHVFLKERDNTRLKLLAVFGAVIGFVLII